jgi:hypothetical protein
MKVLRVGNEVILPGAFNEPDSTWPKARICTGYGNGKPGCGSALVITKSDLFRTSHSYHGRAVNGVQPWVTDYFLTFECPQCGNLTDCYGARSRPYNKKKL